MTEKTNLNKDESNDEVFQKKEDSYREIKKQERIEKQKESKLSAIRNKAMDKLFFIQNKMFEERRSEIGIQSELLVAIGKFFNNPSSWKWHTVDNDYEQHISPEEFYAEVHDRHIATWQPSRFLPKNISKHHPEVLKTNIMVSKVRMKQYEFNGYTSSLLAFVMLFGAATLSAGIHFTKEAGSKAYTKIEQVITTEALSDYFESMKPLNREQLKEELAKINSDSNNMFKVSVIEYLQLKIDKKEFEAKYPEGSQVPDAEKYKYQGIVSQINQKLAFIKANEKEKVPSNEKTKTQGENK